MRGHFDCEKIMERLKEERDEILHKQFQQGTKMLDQIPAFARNQLVRVGVKNDCDLVHYVDGDFECDKSWGNFNFNAYEKAKTRKERLMIMRCIGKISADRTIEVLESNGVQLKTGKECFK